MAIFYRLVKDGRKDSPYKGDYFARTVNLGTIETDELASIIERNCSMKRSDVLAVLAELSDTIRRLFIVPAAGYDDYRLADGRPQRSTV